VIASTSPKSITGAVVSTTLTDILGLILFPAASVM